MKLVIYTNAISAHQLPLARELALRLGDGEFRYVYTGERDYVRQEVVSDEPWIVREDALDEQERENLLFGCGTLLVGGIRPIDLMERRLAHGKKTFYMSERWFKPVLLLMGLSLPGWVRLFHPRYFHMAGRFARLFWKEGFKFLSIGPWAKADMKLICRIMGIRIDKEKISDWGYFVDKGIDSACNEGEVHSVEQAGDVHSVCCVLWVGRLLSWKRVDAIIRAVGEAAARSTRLNITLDIYGAGPEEMRLKKLAAKYGDAIKFHPPVSMNEVRQLMRDHDLYVFSSNAFEGWGAVVSEALTEGMTVIGTYEAGASAALLPESNLFHCGDRKRLAELLRNPPPKVPLPYDYTPQGAAERLLKL